MNTRVTPRLAPGFGPDGPRRQERKPCAGTPAAMPGGKAPRTRVERAERGARVARSPLQAERLGRLRLELGRMPALPCNAQDAHAAIVQALARAGLDDWSVPALDDPVAARRKADGSWRLQLLAHVIVINPWGAFRIDDMRSTAATYYESPGCGGRRFVGTDE